MHRVNQEAIGASRGTRFAVGMVIVQGKYPYGLWGDNVDRKTTALTNIPVEGICEVLSQAYGLNIDSSIERKLEVDVVVQQKNLCVFTNPCYRRAKYTRYHGLFDGPRGGCYEVKDGQVGDVVFIEYIFAPSAFNNTFYYDISVQSGAEVLVRHRGVVGTASSSETMVTDFEKGWADFIRFAGKIPEALNTDIEGK